VSYVLRALALCFMVSHVGCGSEDDGMLTKQELQDACLSDAGLDPGAGYYDSALSDSICNCVVASDERPFGESGDLSETPSVSPDERVGDSALAHWNDEIRRTRCGCCHNTSFRGPGTAYWDLAFEPVWVDSASDVRLRVMSGEGDKPGQTVPFPDPAPFRAFVEQEIARRQAVRMGN
jgi:hypothetical protein